MKRPSFTLIELLLVIGIIGILASVVIVAVNPAKMFKTTKNTVRIHDIKQIESAMLQYLIDGKILPTMPASITSAKDMCQQTVTGTACTVTENGVDLSDLAPVYFANLPVDPDETGGKVSGYRVYRDGSFYKACSPILDPTCGAPLSSSSSSSSASYIGDPWSSSSSSSSSVSSSASTSMTSSSSAPPISSSSSGFGTDGAGGGLGEVEIVVP